MFAKMIKRWLPMMLWMAAIYIFSAQPSDDLPGFGVWDLLIKKGAHFTAYLILALFVFLAVGGGKRPYLLSFLITLLYAVSDEFHQTFVPGRNGTPLDVMIDTAGGATGLWVLYRLRLKRQKTNQKRMQSPMPMSDQP